MKIVPPTKQQIYSAFNEIDDLMMEYRRENPQSGHDEEGIQNEYALLLSELGVDRRGIVEASAGASAGLIESLKSVVTGHAYRASAKDAIETIVQSGKLNRDNMYFLFLTTCWAEGFTVGLVIHEQAGRAWDEIPEAFFHRMRDRRANVKDSTYRNGMLQLMIKSVQEVCTQRCADLWYSLHGATKPVILPSFEKKIMDIASIAFMDGVYMTYFVDFRE